MGGDRQSLIFSIDQLRKCGASVFSDLLPADIRGDRYISKDADIDEQGRQPFFLNEIADECSIYPLGIEVATTTTVGDCAMTYLVTAKIK